MTLNDISTAAKINLDKLSCNHKKLYTSGLFGTKYKDDTLVNKNILLLKLKDHFCDRGMDCVSCMGKKPYDMRCNIHLDDVLDFIYNYKENDND